MFKASFQPHILEFNFAAGTSRGVLHTKPSWFLKVTHTLTQNVGLGEVSLIPGLSVEKESEVPSILQNICDRLNQGEMPLIEEFNSYPAIQFALETVIHDLAYAEDYHPFPGKFTNGKHPIPINGLVWMGNEDFMTRQIQEKIATGFSCIKMKIGAIDFNTELEILKFIRKQFSPEEIEIRVDANGAFTSGEALKKLEQLSVFHIHSIEQPIAVDQWTEMAVLCANSPIPIALDEELIGFTESAYKLQMLRFIQPQYIILKPSLIGGFSRSNEWIQMAQENNIGWWATSALESNIGLNAIAQWVSHKDTQMPQGLGTGKLFTNNINAPLAIKNGQLHYHPNQNWGTLPNE